jgi:hypothetical protein
MVKVVELNPQKWGKKNKPKETTTKIWILKLHRKINYSQEIMF